MSSFHKDINCDACGQQNLAGTRYACLVCHDYDLCENCHRRRNAHPFHPMQTVLTQRDFVLQYGANGSSPEELTIYRCPYCNQDGFSLGTLLKHARALHHDCSQKVRCPACVTFRTGRYGTHLLDWSLAMHIENAHMRFGTDVELKFKLLQYAATSHYKEIATWNADSDGAKCTICSLALGQDAGLYQFLDCGHGFHRACVETWLRDRTDGATCPSCREPNV
uniref:E3 ubiquitin-protein ligase KCMF1 n=3 Tax=Culex pipiens TaxID=7175 RepID=A0A8D8BXS9_CULPI